MYLLTNWSSSGGEKHYANWIKRAKTGQTPPQIGGFFKKWWEVRKEGEYKPPTKTHARMLVSEL